MTVALGFWAQSCLPHSLVKLITSYKDSDHSKNGSSYPHFQGANSSGLFSDASGDGVAAAACQPHGARHGPLWNLACLHKGLVCVLAQRKGVRACVHEFVQDVD